MESFFSFLGDTGGIDGLKASYMFWTLLAGNTSSMVYVIFGSVFFPFFAPFILVLFPPPAEALALPTVSHFSDIVMGYGRCGYWRMD